MNRMDYIEDLSGEEKLVDQAFAGKYVLPINIERFEKNFESYTENVEEIKERLDIMNADPNMNGDAMDMYLDDVSQTTHLYKLFKAVRSNYEKAGIEISGNEIVLAKVFNAMYGGKPYMSYICSRVIRDVQEAFRWDVDVVSLSEFAGAVDDIGAFLQNMVESNLNARLSPEAVDKVDVIRLIGYALYHGVAVHVNAEGEIIYLKTETVRENQASTEEANKWHERCSEFKPVVSYTRGVMFTMIVDRVLELIKTEVLNVENDEFCRYAEINPSKIDAGQLNILQYLNQLYDNPQDKLMGINKIVSTLAGDLFLLGKSEEA